MGMKEEYLEKIESQIKEWTGKVNELQARADEAAAEVKMEMDRHIQNLRVKLGETQRKLTEVREASAETWVTFRASLDQSLKDLQHVWEEAVGHKEAYLGMITAQLQEWGARLDELKAKAEAATADLKGEMGKRLTQLRSQQEAAQEKLRELQEGGAEKWETLKANSEKAMGDLKKAWQSFKSRYL
jgi:hypothetical protein